MVDRHFSDPDLAGLYDLISPTKRRADFRFYLPLVMQAQAVLDVGCGTGAMLHEARQAGHSGRLCGIDPAAGMLTVARKRTDVEWVQADLGAASFENEFDLVVMTGHAFQVLIEDHDIRDALAAVRKALTVGGRFAFETRNPAARSWESWRPDKQLKIADAKGTTVKMWTEVVSPFDGRTVSFTHTYASVAWSEPKISRSTLRFLSAPSLRTFLVESGFMIAEQFGDWDRAPLSDVSPEIITIARAA